MCADGNSCLTFWSIHSGANERIQLNSSSSLIELKLDYSSFWKFINCPNIIRVIGNRPTQVGQSVYLQTTVENSN